MKTYHTPYTLQRHLYLSILKISLNESIQDFVINSSILSNTFIQLGFPSSDSLGEFPKSLKKFATSDMEYHKEIINLNSIDFNELTKKYAHSSGDRKTQTRPTYARKYDGTKLIVTNISPLKPRPEAIKHLSSIFGRFDIDEENPLHLSET